MCFLNLRHVGYLFGQRGEQLRRLGVVVSRPECLETVQLVRGFEVADVALRGVSLVGGLRIRARIVLRRRSAAIARNLSLVLGWRFRWL